jgi:hypothetical protein
MCTYQPREDPNWLQGPRNAKCAINQLKQLGDICTYRATHSESYEGGNKEGAVTWSNNYEILCSSISGITVDLRQLP